MLITYGLVIILSTLCSKKDDTKLIVVTLSTIHRFLIVFR